MRSRCTLAALAVALLAPSALPAAAQEKGRAFADTVEVRVVDVEVHVTGRDGRPVTGLGPEDFQIFEDGRRVPITNFYVVEEGTPAAATTPVAEARPRPPAAGPSPEVPPPPAEQRRLHLVVYVDQLDLTPGLRNRTLEGLELFLEERLTRGDRVMVAASGPSFATVLPFTEDRQAVIEAVRGLQKTSTVGLAQDRRLIQSRIERAANSPDLALEAETIHQGIRLYAQRTMLLLRRELLGLRGFISSLEELPGRKAVLHLSEGLPLRPGEELFAEWEAAFGGGDGSEGFLEGRQNDLTPELREVIEEANASGVSFYTLDVGGSRTGSSVSAESRGLSAALERIGGPEIEVLTAVNLQTPLQMLAAETGGVPILNANRPWVVLEDLAPAFDSYYSLGYEPPDRTPGKYRRIRVEVSRPGLSVRHREGYRITTAAGRFENRTVAALLHGSWANPLGVFVELGRERRGKKKRFRVPVEVKIPLGHLTLVPRGAVHEGKVRVRVAFEGEGGEGFGIADELEVPIAIPERDLGVARASHFTVAVELVLEAGLHRVAVGVWDEVGAQASFVPYEVHAGGG